MVAWATLLLILAAVFCRVAALLTGLAWLRTTGFWLGLTGVAVAFLPLLALLVVLAWQWVAGAESSKPR